MIGFATAAVLDVPFRFCERKERAMRLRRGFELYRGERVVVVEDVVTTGGSAREAGELARSLGAQVVAYGAIIDRSAGSAVFECPLECLLEVAARAWESVDCELCAQGIALSAPGSRSHGGAA